MKKKVNLDQQKKSKNGNSFEKQVASGLRDKKDIYGIIKLAVKKRFYYNEKTTSEKIYDAVKDECKGLTKAQITKLIAKAVNECLLNSDEPFRSNTKNYKEADISFLTKNKYIYNGMLSNVRFIIDTTTSARTDRIKGKAQDSSVYKTLGFPYIYLIVLPNDSAFKDYKNPKMEQKLCENAVYDANFGKVYEKDNVSLIVRQKDLDSLLKYVEKNKGKDINKVITSWKNKNYAKMKARYKEEMKKNVEMITNEVLKMMDE